MSALLFLLPLYASGYYIRVFSDIFQNLNNWVVDVMPGQDSGNNEWEYYTSSPSNVFTSTSSYGSHLSLRAVQEAHEGYNYTSGKVHSQNQFGPYGFFNVRAIVPKGNALWPAIWLLPVPPQDRYSGWASCGEIDIMETICNQNDGYSTIHFGGPWPKNVQFPSGGNNKYPFDVDWTQPHWFGVDWQPGYIQFWFDAKVVNGVVQGTHINTIASIEWWSMDANGQHYPTGAPFDKPFNIVLNLAVGGNWPCSIQGCCSSVATPAEMQVFQVDIWEQTQLKEY